MKNIAKHLTKEVGYHGLCGFDWIEDKNGEISILEFHPRATAGYRILNIQEFQLFH